jgi:hypothetical protein
LRNKLVLEGDLAHVVVEAPDLELAHLAGTRENDIVANLLQQVHILFT